MTEQQLNAMKLALEALECTEYPQDHYDAITALREALALVNKVDQEQPAQTDWEAVAADQAMTIALLRAEQPAQRTWVGLTDEEIDDIDFANWNEDYQRWNIRRFARSIEAKLKEKNA